ncbi:hypothetical protein FXN65_26145 [Metapseudomonas lalkuanensis]|uniref:Uncharacterized protein n=1 Tax=Metapseudomonas lalkuanensis TaxID=2604832 RepID=A0A5J6QX75_9GAMM|nr:MULTISPECIES: hypothetical protein [Pseudomonas]MBD2837290.1 hypothetical protein [Pseudomonas sp. JM0905a]QEY65369.1 hypothetical protein FXN65_26145 [Pseudomonas lalkuanensis]
MDKVLKDERWKVAGKTIRQLIVELETFEDKDLVVEMSADGGVSGKSISLVGKIDGKCMLIHIE